MPKTQTANDVTVTATIEKEGNEMTVNTTLAEMLASLFADVDSAESARSLASIIRKHVSELRDARVDALTDKRDIIDGPDAMLAKLEAIAGNAPEILVSALPITSQGLAIGLAMANALPGWTLGNAARTGSRGKTARVLRRIPVAA